MRDLSGQTLNDYLRVSLADKADRQAANFDAERSTSTQRRKFHQYCERAGTVPGREYTDPDISASWYNRNRREDESGWDEALRLRPDFARMVADIRAGELDGQGLWFWRISRQARELEVFIRLRDLCRYHGIFWVVDDEAYDTGNYRHMRRLLDDAADAEGDSVKLSENVYDGKESAALKGRRAGRVPYGYRATFDPRTGDPGPDEADWDEDGNGPAAVVTEAYARVLKGESLTSIRKDLNRRGITTGTGAQWYTPSLRNVLLNPAYAGLRKYQRDAHESIQAAILDGVEGDWPALVSQADWYATYRLLNDPARTTNTPGRPRHGVHLLSSIVVCAVCGGKLIRRARTDAEGRVTSEHYFCRENSCVGIAQRDLDAFAAERIIAWLADPGVVAELHGKGSTAQARQAQGVIAKERAGLEDARQRAEAGRISLDSLERVERGALARIGAAEATLAGLETPKLAAGLTEAAQAGWDALDVTAQRQVIAEVAAIAVHPIGRGHGGPRGKIHPVYRVSWTWKLGPGAGVTIPPLDWEERRAELAALQAERRAGRKYVSAGRRDKLAGLLREDPQRPDREVARLAGQVDRHSIRQVRRELEQAGQIPVIRRTRWQVRDEGYVTPAPAEAAAG